MSVAPTGAAVLICLICPMSLQLSLPKKCRIMCTLGTCQLTLGRYYQPSLSWHIGGQSVDILADNWSSVGRCIGRYSVEMTVEHQPTVASHRTKMYVDCFSFIFTYGPTLNLHSVTTSVDTRSTRCFSNLLDMRPLSVDTWHLGFQWKL